MDVMDELLHAEVQAKCKLAKEPDKNDGSVQRKHRRPVPAPQKPAA